MQKFNDFIPSAEAARIAGVAHRTMRGYALQFPFLAIKIANRLLVNRNELKRLMADGKFGIGRQRNSDALKSTNSKETG